PKKSPTPEKSPTVCGEQTFHCPPGRSRCGSIAVTLGTLNSRIFAKFAEPISCSALFDRLTAKPMFDCPEQIHTSPTATSSSTIGFSVLSPLIVSDDASPSASAGSVAFHSPLSSAVASAVLPAYFTVTFSPGDALPQMD